MTSATPLLPAEFADLEQFAAEWTLDSERARNAFRVSRPLAELDAFYAAVFPRLDAICEYVDRYPLTAMPRSAARLLELALMLMEVVPAVEVYRQPDVPNAFAFERFHVISPKDPITIVD